MKLDVVASWESVAHMRGTGRCGEAMAGVTQRGDEGGEHRQQPQSSDTVNCSG